MSLPTNTVVGRISAGTGPPEQLSAANLVTLTGAELSANKNTASGYAGLNSDSRITKGVITTDDVTVNASSKGLVLKDTDGHFWRLSVSTLGVLTATDLGTSAP